MKLFTKEVDKQLFAQYPKGSDLDNQMVVAKIFNPYGRGVWYLLNSDPEDPDYIWAIVDLFEPDMGSVSRSELQTVKVPPFGLGLERDIYFTPKPAKEVFEGIMRGERFAHGGMTAGRYYKDNSGNEFRYIGESEGKLLFKDGEKIITKSHEDFEDAPKEKKLFGIFADGGMSDTMEQVMTFEEFKKKLPILHDIKWGDNGVEYKPKYNKYSGTIMYFKHGRTNSEKVSLSEAYKHYKYFLEKGEEYADGGAVKGRNNQTGESYGVVIGSIQKADDEYTDAIKMNIRTSYESRICESSVLFDKNGNLLGTTDYGCAYDGKYPSLGVGSGRNYYADKKETLEILSKKYNPAFAKKIIELAKDSKMADGGETAAAEHNIKQAKYGARLVGKQKNLDVNKNGKLDAEDFKMLRGEKMANGGEIWKKGTTTTTKTKADAQRSLNLMKNNNESNKSFKNLKIEKVTDGWAVKFEFKDKMAMGGKVKFEDKVKAVKESLLKRKKVSPKVQKDYGKTYDRKEALEAAKRIVGAQTAKWEKRNKK